MIRLFKAIGAWFSGIGETKRIKARIAAKEQRLQAAALAPGAPAELVDEVTCYFANKPPSDSSIPKVKKEGDHGSR